MSKLSESSPGAGRLPALIALCLIAFQAVASAQTRQRATSAANFLKEPGGIKLGALVTGQTYPTGRTNNRHTETTLEGWIFGRSTEATTRDGFDLIVISGGGENLRASPGGALVARLQEGTLLTRVEARGGWLRVRRVGWVPSTALEAAPTVARANPPPPPPVARDTAATRPPAVAARGDSTPSAVAAPPGAAASTVPDAPADPAVAGTASLRDGARLALTPDGNPIAALSTGTEAQVLGRSGDWVQVRIQGWVPAADVAAEVRASPRITAAMLLAEPQRYVGQTVTWRVQFLAVQTADALRPEMPAGQTYILARGPLPESGFTYIMVNRAQADEFRRLAPLDEVAVEAIVRSSRTRYLPTPVLELTRIVR